MNRVYRSKRVEGKSIAGLIHNMEYFYTEVSIFEDGVIDCWENIEYDEIKPTIDRDWLTCEIPLGKNISIYGVGTYKVKSAKWIYNKENYYQHILNIIKELNPEIENINNSLKKISKQDRKRKVALNSIPFKMVGNERFYSLFDGEKANIFYKEKEKFYLTTLIAYEDKTFEISMLGEKYFSLEEIREMFEKNILTTEIEDNFIIEGLGELEVERLYGVDKSEKFKEIEDMMRSACGEQTTRELCQEAYFEYLVDPCEYTKERLREAYERVPEHERMYLGDMDSKDWDYHRILYTEEKREV